MIAYCPLEDIEPHYPVVHPVKTPPFEEAREVSEETELNYVVMGFLIGVILLAIPGQINK